MQYTGGKARIARDIAQATLKHTDRRGEYHEPFLGGANAFEYIAPHFSDLHVSDVVPDLALLYQAVAVGWEPPIAISKELWHDLRRSPPSPLRAVAGFGHSFGGKWFSSYAANNPDNGQDFAGAAGRSLNRIRPLLQRAHISCKSYTACSPSRNAVVYCDPPYRGTFSYGAKFDHDHFWSIMQAWAIFGAHVFVSEYEAPEGWRAIWEKDHQCKMRADGKTLMRREKLFVWGG